MIVWIILLETFWLVVNIFAEFVDWENGNVLLEREEFNRLHSHFNRMIVSEDGNDWLSKITFTILTLSLTKHRIDFLGDIVPTMSTAYLLTLSGWREVTAIRATDSNQLSFSEYGEEERGGERMKVHVAKNSSRFITFMNLYYKSLKFRKNGNAESIVSYIRWISLFLTPLFNIIDKIYLLYDK